MKYKHIRISAGFAIVFSAVVPSDGVATKTILEWLKVNQVELRWPKELKIEVIEVDRPW